MAPIRLAGTRGAVNRTPRRLLAPSSRRPGAETLEFKQMGVGRAAAVSIDATIVRAVLLPATMKLLGDWNWYLPRRLQRMPRIVREPSLVTQSARRNTLVRLRGPE